VPRRIALPISRRRGLDCGPHDRERRDRAACTTSGREIGVLGEPRVDVLVVNLALDRTFGGVNPE
jgi:K+-transporting ATPase c subunit